MSESIRIMQTSNLVAKYVKDTIKKYFNMYSKSDTFPLCYTVNIPIFLKKIAELRYNRKLITQVAINIRNLKLKKIIYAKQHLKNLADDIDYLILRHERMVAALESEKMFTEEAFQWSMDKRLPYCGLTIEQQCIVRDINEPLYTSLKSQADYSKNTLERTIRFADEDYPDLYWYREQLINDSSILPDIKEDYLKLLTYFDIRFLISVICIESVAYKDHDFQWERLDYVDKKIYIGILEKLESVRTK